jgi:hypothetical protein
LEREIELEKIKMELRKKKEVDEYKKFERGDFSLPISGTDFSLTLYGFMSVLEALFVVYNSLLFSSLSSQISLSSLLRSNNSLKELIPLDSTLESSSTIFSSLNSSSSLDSLAIPIVSQQKLIKSDKTSDIIIEEFLTIPALKWIVSRFLFRVYDWDQDEKITGSDLYSVLSTLQPDIHEDDLLIIGLLFSIFILFFFFFFFFYIYIMLFSHEQFC